VLSLLAWGGQVVSWRAPDLAVRLTLMEAEDDVDPVFWADLRGEAMWDAFTLWALVVAGGLLILDQSAWAYFGLVGGGAYLYFAGRGISARMALQSRGLRVGATASVKIGYVFLVVWGLMAMVTIAASVVALS
jgi:hypothetical protein